MEVDEANKANECGGVLQEGDCGEAILVWNERTTPNHEPRSVHMQEFAEVTISTHGQMRPKKRIIAREQVDLE